ncbi:peptidylprolyl isomerase [Chitinophaga sancti]|nr:peptidylprolyl isomerase [Chitinophaga sancti]WQD61228.1 peptidylprolyl isomerase [Chitinophaga sancti]WQG86645.1 peptidylprolyl isomerase [Chitinophaga sancti]
MMKYIYASLFLLILAACNQKADTRSEEIIIDRAANIEQAYKVVEKYPFIKLYPLSSEKDTTAVDKKLFSLNIGDTATIEANYYKVIADTGNYTFRAQYILLDAAVLTHAHIDSLRTLIQQQYAAGKSFEELNSKYNMDPNQKDGDTGPFTAGMMVKPFEDAIARHKQGDIFTVDVPDKKWYFVVKKTYADVGEKIRIVLGFKKGN